MLFPQSLDRDCELNKFYFKNQYVVEASQAGVANTARLIDNERSSEREAI